MAVAPNTAAELVRQIFDLQRAVRCVAVSNSRGLEAGIALQGVLRFVGEKESRATQLAALTDAGRAKLVDIEEHRVATLQEFLQDWSQQDAEETAKVLSKLSESLRESARATT